MSVAQRTVFMSIFGMGSLIPEDFNDEHPLSWKQFRVVVRETLLLENIPARRPAIIVNL